MGQGEDREITYQLPSWAKETQPEATVFNLQTKFFISSKMPLGNISSTHYMRNIFLQCIMDHFVQVMLPYSNFLHLGSSNYVCMVLIIVKIYYTSR